MKKMFFAVAMLATFSLFLNSCGSKGFTDEQRKQFKDLCMIAKTMGMDSTAASKECDCYVTKLEKDHPDGGSADDRFNGMEAGCGTAAPETPKADDSETPTDSAK